MLAGTVSSKGQVTIPKEIRKVLRVGPSDKVVFTPLGKGKALITSANRSASDVFGILKHRKLERPVSIDEMEFAIKNRQIRRSKA
ncbi:MAG: AbrB family transcriptional regulator [Deltaproteobacteria bacterium]|nr:MAG: AbrB family transcriptional regulator [Deltaproteobacteria bacterium]